MENNLDSKQLDEHIEKVLDAMPILRVNDAVDDSEAIEHHEYHTALNFKKLMDAQSAHLLRAVTRKL